MAERACEQCGGTLPDHNPNHAPLRRFCTDKCRRKAWRDSHLPERREYAKGWREKNGEHYKAYARKMYNTHISTRVATNAAWYLENKHKSQAHNAVARAVASGKLVPTPCEVCSEPKTEGHHEDYSKQLEVRWLCRRHHQRRHHAETN